MPTLRLTAIHLAAVLVASVGAGCASSGYPGLSTAEAENRHVSILVRNDNWHDVRIYLISDAGGPPRRLGSVASLSTSTVRIPYAKHAYVRLLLRPLGTRASYVTHSIYVEPGRALQLNVANALSQSSFIAR